MNSECPFNAACINNKCSNPCLGICGIDAECSVVNHYPICSCPPHLKGDPLSRCDVTPDCKTSYVLSNDRYLTPNRSSWRLIHFKNIVTHVVTFI